MTRRPAGRFLVTWIAVAWAAVLIGACTSPGDSPPSERPSLAPTASSANPGSTPDPTAARRLVRAKPGSALAGLSDLPVRGRGPLTGYEREAFGPAWTDTDRNGCDTRNDILRRDLQSLVFKAGSDRCAVQAGRLDDPYTARPIDFVYGGASEVDIDHVVALANAWVSGAAGWPYAKQVGFANDPLVLLAVDAFANRQKGDGDAATWLPSNRSYRCTYAARQVSIKAKYALSITPAERAAMERILRKCPDQPLLTGGSPTVSSVLPPR